MRGENHWKMALALNACIQCSVPYKRILPPGPVAVSTLSGTSAVWKDFCSCIVLFFC